MEIASLVIHALPERLDAVRAGFAGIPGVSLNAATPDGRLVVTVEDVAGQTVPQAIDRLQAVDGVMSVLLAYQYSDAEQDA
ncbi:MAG: chaperone NapD [Betaproteobacteria bacterium]|nr:chaperone NapD [Betaproteobacteria bacterium]